MTSATSRVASYQITMGDGFLYVVLSTPPTDRVMAKAKSPPPPAPDDPASLAFEESLERLEAIVERIETGDAGLEEALADYERGVALVARCRSVLTRAQSKLAELTVDEENGLQIVDGEDRES